MTSWQLFPAIGVTEHQLHSLHLRGHNLNHIQPMLCVPRHNPTPANRHVMRPIYVPAKTPPVLISSGDTYPDFPTADTSFDLFRLFACVECRHWTSVVELSDDDIAHLDQAAEAGHLMRTAGRR